MTTHEINLLIERYLDGETTPAEERALALAIQREDRPAEWAIIAEMLGELTLDEAIYETLPRPSKGGESISMSDSNSNTKAPFPRRSRGRSLGGISWAAAACIAVAFALSYNIINNKAPQEIAQAEPPLPASVPTRLTASPDRPVTTPTKPATSTKPTTTSDRPTTTSDRPTTTPDRSAVPPKPAALPINSAASSPSSLSCDASHDPTPARPATPAELTQLNQQTIAEEPEVPEELPPPDRLALCMALLTEVEAHTLMLQQEQEPLFEDTYETIEVQLLNELIANIQQHSNRPELSL